MKCSHLLGYQVKWIGVEKFLRLFFYGLFCFVIDTLRWGGVRCCRSIWRLARIWGGTARLSQSIELSYLKLAFTSHHSEAMWDVSHQGSLRTYSKRQKGF